MAPALKTYSHLAHRRRVPSEYELTTTELLYHPARGFEVAVPLDDWYRRYQRSSPFACADWERFEDPRQTTYTRYTALQSRQEAHVDGLLDSIDDRGYDLALPEPALALLARAAAPLRFAFHGLQMVAAYVGQMAPSGRITIAALLQAADEMRRLQRIAYRTAQLRRAHPALARIDEESRALWQEHPGWQPLRRLVERLLVTYDWGEALVALNVCAKPLLDGLTMVGLPAAALQAGDYLLGEIFFSMEEDCRWHRAWTVALLEMVMDARAETRDAVAGWTAAWLPAASEAGAAYATLFEAGGDRPAGNGAAGALGAAEAGAAAFRRRLGLEGPA